MLTPLRTVDAPTPPPPTTETTTEDATPPAPGWTGTPWSAPQNGRPTLGGGPYVFPVAGAVSFSDTWGAARATTGWHHGIDIFAPLASPVVAVADGVLFSVGWNDVGGNRVWLRDRAGNFFYYAHLSAFAAIAVNGARVPAGTVIGFVGNTGDAEGTPYHLHFEIHPRSLLSLGYDGAVSPFPYLRAWQRKGGLLRGVVGRAVAPEPGAILIGYTDISSADGLSSAPLEQTLDRPLVAQAAVQDSQPVPAARAVTESIPPPGADDVRLARTLDTAAAQPEAQEPTVWDALAVCESGGGWSTNTGNGFVGGLQFLPQTWAANGGTFFAPSAHLATREQQILVAQRVLASQGWNAWPACSLALGLRGSDGR